MPQTLPAPEPVSSDQPPTGAERTPPNDPRSIRRRLRVLPVLGTVLVALVGVGAAWILWQDYVARPWTRDGTVRAYIVTLAPEVSGRVAELAIKDNQLVHKGDLLMRIDPRDFQVAVDLANAAVDQATADYENKQAQRERRLKLTDLAASKEEQQTYASAADMARAEVAQQKANLERARINLERTEIRAPVSGWVTNLLVRQGDYATAGQMAMSIVDADSFWVDGYFEETALRRIAAGDPAKVWLLGYGKVLEGHVDSVARGIVVSNATPGKSGLASVNPVFTWVRLAQRIPVRIQLDQIPPEIKLVVGMTASIEVEPSPQSSGSAPESQPATSASKP
jgi:RND family efflux transporter MFP subunit